MKRSDDKGTLPVSNVRVFLFGAVTGVLAIAFAGIIAGIVFSFLKFVDLQLSSFWIVFLVQIGLALLVVSVVRKANSISRNHSAVFLFGASMILIFWSINSFIATGG